MLEKIFKRYYMQKTVLLLPIYSSSEKIKVLLFIAENKG